MSDKWQVTSKHWARRIFNLVTRHPSLCHFFFVNNFAADA